jgi:hypothetical protein
MMLDGPLPPLQEGRIIYHCIVGTLRMMGASSTCATHGVLSSVRVSPPWITSAQQPTD